MRIFPLCFHASDMPYFQRSYTFESSQRKIVFQERKRMINLVHLFFVQITVFHQGLFGNFIQQQIPETRQFLFENPLVYGGIDTFHPAGWKIYEVYIAMQYRNYLCGIKLLDKLKHGEGRECCY